MILYKEMTEYTLQNGSILSNGEKVGEITFSNQNGMQSIHISGPKEFDLVRSMGGYTVMSSGTEVGRLTKMSHLEYEGQSYDVSRRQLTRLLLGSPDAADIKSYDMTIGKIINSAGSLTASSDFNGDVALIYLGAMSRGMSAYPRQGAGRYQYYRIPRSYRYASTAASLGSLIFLYAVYTGSILGTGYDLIAFFVLIALSYIFRFLGRRKVRDEEATPPIQ